MLAVSRFETVKSAEYVCRRRGCKNRGKAVTNPPPADAVELTGGPWLCLSCLGPLRVVQLNYEREAADA